LYYDSETAYVGYGDGWSSEEYRTVTFVGGYVSEEFYNWFISNTAEVTE
jgi:hypothetical protein